MKNNSYLSSIAVILLVFIFSASPGEATAGPKTKAFYSKVKAKVVEIQRSKVVRNVSGLLKSPTRTTTQTRTRTSNTNTRPSSGSNNNRNNDCEYQPNQSGTSSQPTPSREPVAAPSRTSSGSGSSGESIRGRTGTKKN